MNKKKNVTRPIYALLFLLLFLAGCGPGKIDQIIVQGSARSHETQAVQLIREGENLITKKEMSLKKGDEIITDSSAMAILWLQGGSRIFIGNDTHIRLVNPFHIIDLLSGISEKISRIFIEAKDSLQINTEYTATITKGTRFSVTLQPGGITTIMVFDGAVSVDSLGQPFQPVHLSNFMKATVQTGQTPKTEIAPQDEANEIIQWINGMEQASGNKKSGLMVPDVTGLTMERAELVIREAGFSIGKRTGRITKKYRIGSIVEQRPSPGNLVQANARIELFFEAEPAAIPSLVGKPISQAGPLLQRARLNQGRVSYKITGNWRQDTIIEQNPGPGTVVPVQTPVHLVVEAVSVVVPKLVGMEIKTVRRLIQESRLTMGPVSESMAGSYRPGMVTSQSPAQNIRVEPGTRVALVVEVDSTVIPDLMGVDISRARQMLRQSRLTVGSVSESITGNFRPGVVGGQAPPKGTRVKPGSVINLSVEADSTVVPQLINYPLQTALNRLQSARLGSGSIRNELTDRFNTGIVMGQALSAGTRVRPRTRVDLTVSERGVRVPSLSNRSDRSAISLLNQIGLRRGHISYSVSSNYSPNTVLSQAPGPGSLVKPGTYVNLILSQRPPRQPTPVPVPIPSTHPTPPVNLHILSTCTVPFVKGKTEEHATAVLRSKGFRVKVTVRASGNFVYSLTPDQGTSAPCGSWVYLIIGTIN